MSNQSKIAQQIADFMNKTIMEMLENGHNPFQALMNIAEDKSVLVADRITALSAILPYFLAPLAPEEVDCE